MLMPFLCSLAGGTLATLGGGRVELISWRFYRVVGIVVLALALTSIAWVLLGESESHPAVWLLCGAAAGAAVGVIGLARAAQRRAGLLRCVCIGGGAAGLAAGVILAVAGLSTEPTSIKMLVCLSQILGGMLLGSATVAWLLGHAYLTATSMTITPLRRFMSLLSWAVALRALFMCASLGLAWSRGGDPGSPLTQLLSAWLALSLRIGLGVIGLGAFVYMAADCVRLRSTQSATGILYFGSIFAYVGELAAQYVLLECGWPV